MKDLDPMAVAALFESEFSIDWLIQITGERASALLEVLEIACEHGVLSRQHYGRFSFTSEKKRFQHRSRLTSKEAADVHRRIAGILIQELPEDAEKAVRISGHLAEVENDLERCGWFAAAGDIFRRSNRIGEALQAYRQALSGLSSLKGRAGDELYVRTALTYSKITDFQFDTKHTQKFLLHAMERAAGIGDRRSAVLLEMHLAKNLWYRSRYAGAIRRFNHAWQVSQESDDQALRRSAVTFSTFFHYWQGRFQDAIAIYERDISDLDKVPRGEFSVMAAATIGYCYTLTGHSAHGIGIIGSVHELSHSRGDELLKSFCEIVMAISLLNVQRLDEAAGYIRKVHGKTKRWPDSPLSVFSPLLLSYTHHLQGDAAKATRYLSTFLEKRKRLEVSMWPYSYLLELCWEIETGNLPAVRGLSMDGEIRAALKTGNAFLIGIAHRFKAFSLKRKGQNKPEITRALRKSVDWLEKTGHRIETARSALALADYLTSIDRIAESDYIKAETAKSLIHFNPNYLPAGLKTLLQINHKKQCLPDTVLEIGRRLSENSDSIEMIHHLIKSCNQLLGAERGGVFVPNPENRKGPMRLLAGRNLSRDQIIGDGFRLSMETIRNTFELEKGILIDKVPREGAAVNTLICEPIRHGADLLGVNYYDNCLLDDAFGPDAQDTLSFYASLIGHVMVGDRNREELDSIRAGADTLSLPEGSCGAHGMIGNSPEMQRVYSTIDLVADTDATVMILGETGVGKELVANAVHQASSRCDRPFVAVNCNALPEQLIGSELFGHEKGAFTGAHEKRRGRFEIAHRGTLFIDEIGEMPLDTQVRLLRVLQEKQFERIGGSQTIESDFRLIVATNRDIEEEVRKGKFRADLFYRLSTFPIVIPPLRDRKNDIPLLAGYFVKKSSHTSGKSITSLPERELALLQRHSWPGNVRELEHIIERGVILSPGSIFQTPDLTPTVLGNGTSEFPRNLTLEELERRYILQTLLDSGWRIRGKGGTADTLGLNPSTLYSRMKKLGISRPWLT